MGTPHFDAQGDPIAPVRLAARGRAQRAGSEPRADCSWGSVAIILSPEAGARAVGL